MFTQKVHSTGVKNCSVFEVHNSGLYPALERLPFSGFQSSLIADRRGSAIRPAIETLQKANRSCDRARTATVHRKGIFLFT
ncbi:MAG: hypothetical protein JRI35_06800 [Deltaproteobacteria bacterium]|nr:hypothetical protein [Deltaproteobacteria bacterium]